MGAYKAPSVLTIKHKENIFSSVKTAAKMFKSRTAAAVQEPVFPGKWQEWDAFNDCNNLNEGTEGCGFILDSYIDLLDDTEHSS